ncbi:hypothetical protein GLAREA_02159 [Glarea lozoyensis ATCC 20868]|uniref:Uncharacterized protein n=1 Tax=Glarea lozoyensis (strain ATCC 20868 / MF5171) TaxID=1116229 RepID=S3CIE0_GLAL2|nr:uncharacterized protein GLAREA_02159 [Glarea lozoyensis ATCC 20868]EPE26247.1 hypothetical protein GLAREA_02159 [Glarea lozoyensis ATCC 20868]
MPLVLKRKLSDDGLDRRKREQLSKEEDPDRPRVVFGLELELDFVVVKSVHQAWTDERRHPLNTPYKSKRNRILDQHTATTNSEAWGILLSLAEYLAIYLSHEHETQTKKAGPLGRVIFAQHPKQARSDAWHVTIDDSLNPDRQDLSKYLDIDFVNAKANYRVSGAELVSSVLDYEEEETWSSMLKQIQQGLASHWSKFQETRLPQDLSEQFAFFESMGTEALHLHISLPDVPWDSPLGISCVKNIMVLYGLCETEIETWFSSRFRNDQWCQRLTGGTEFDKSELVDARYGLYSVTELGSRFTPKTYTKAIYDCEELWDIKSYVSGQRKPGTYANGLPVVVRDIAHYTAINISPSRPNKPWTLGFRQHHGTIDKKEITWWTTFCVALIRYAFLMARVGITVTDAEEWVWRRSILDTINFPLAGVAHFEAQRDKFFVPFIAAKAYPEREMIKERMRKVEIAEAKAKAEGEEGKDLPNDTDGLETEEDSADLNTQQDSDTLESNTQAASPNDIQDAEDPFDTEATSATTTPPAQEEEEVLTLGAAMDEQIRCMPSYIAAAAIPCEYEGAPPGRSPRPLPGYAGAARSETKCAVERVQRGS